MAAYLANVGANASHPLRSPLRADGSFFLWPILESVPWGPPMLRLRDVAGDAGSGFTKSWLDRAVHLDPDLGGPHKTYGDNCRRAGRAFSLRRAEPGDLILFLARLHPPASSPALHFVAALEIDEIKADLTADPGPGWWDKNAHVRRARAIGAWDSFWVFSGTPRSGPLKRAQPLTPALAAELLPIAWRATRTDQQTIASHTRAVRRLTGPAETVARALWNT